MKTETALLIFLIGLGIFIVSFSLLLHRAGEEMGAQKVRLEAMKTGNAIYVADENGKPQFRWMNQKVDVPGSKQTLANP